MGIHLVLPAAVVQAFSAIAVVGPIYFFGRHDLLWHEFRISPSAAITEYATHASPPTLATDYEAVSIAHYLDWKDNGPVSQYHRLWSDAAALVETLRFGTSPLTPAGHASTNYIIRPASDAGINQGIPFPGPPNYAQVDDDPHDLNATYLRFENNGDRDFFGLSAADISTIPDSDIIAALNPKFAYSGISDPDVGIIARAGFRVTGATQYGLNQEVSGVAFQTFETDSFGEHPVQNRPWLKSDLAGVDLALEMVSLTAETTRPRVTALVAKVFTTTEAGISIRDGLYMRERPGFLQFRKYQAQPDGGGGTILQAVSSGSTPPF